MKFYFTVIVSLLAIVGYGQTFSGTVLDSETGLALENVVVTIVEDELSVNTDGNGNFSLTAANNDSKTVTFELDNYMFEELREQGAGVINVALRQKKISAASSRWEHYMESCTNYNSPNIPDNQVWNLEFTESALTGDLVANSTYTRRDPSKVIQVGNKYYVWYTYCLSEASTYFGTSDPDDKVFPWDKCDIYYATSTDGYQWEEQGAAVERGSAGSFDDRSVFTPEIFVHEGKYYLVYQVVKSPYIERVKNNVAMAVADSPDGPWRKLDEPILRPTNNGIWTEGSTSRLDADKKGDFDSHKVHDPCLIYYKNKFYLYYKGERMGEEQYCGEREIKWGVAIADHPEGPYVKSEYNPITNTGHEVSVWPYNEGITIIQKLDGPEIGSVQFADDGLNFEMMGEAHDVPDALGLFNPETHENSPSGGVKWGLCHVLRWDIISGGWMYLQRFDLVDTLVRNVAIVPDTIIMQIGDTLTLDYGLYPLSAKNKDVILFSVNKSIATIDPVSALVTAIKTGETQISVIASQEGHRDDVVVIVTDLTNVSLSDNNSNIRIYPNPAKEFIRIDGISEARIEMYDYSGKLVLSKPSQNIEGSPISVKGLSKGIYIIRISNNGTSISKKIFVQ